MTESEAGCKVQQAEGRSRTNVGEIWRCPKLVGVAGVGLNVAVAVLRSGMYRYPYSVLRYGTVTTCILHRLSTPPPHAMCKRVPSNHVQSCSTMFNHAKCSLTPRPKTLYALFMYRSRPHAPNVYSSNTVLSADHSLYNENSRCLSNPYMICTWVPREAEAEVVSLI